MKTGPFISCYGISTYDPSYEYGARLDRMLSLISKAAFAKSKLDEFTDPPDLTSSKDVPHCNSGDGDEILRKDLSKLAETNKVGVATVEVFLDI